MVSDGFSSYLYLAGEKVKHMLNLNGFHIICERLYLWTTQNQN